MAFGDDVHGSPYRGHRAGLKYQMGTGGRDGGMFRDSGTEHTSW